ncbi:MAG: type pilin accessory protein [Gammaproteobacteria bacterium]|nr:type pilin accessory protein [Gammaproteobacteria bacterium]
MRFRLTAFGLHLLGSCIALSLILGTLYAVWYRWPGWYLTEVAQVTLVLAGVDIVVGPLLTFIIASSKKPRRALTRDIAVIAAVQLCALIYGAVSLWNGRPLYYAFSEDVLQLVQAYDVDPQELDLARQQHAPLVPHWYSAPRWIWAPLPEDSKEHDRIVSSAISGGDDVISMPRYYKPWDSGLPTLRKQLKKVEDVKYFSRPDKELLEQRMRAAGIATDQLNSMPLTGRGPPLLAVFDPDSLTLRAILKAK